MPAVSRGTTFLCRLSVSAFFSTLSAVKPLLEGAPEINKIAAKIALFRDHFRKPE